MKMLLVRHGEILSNIKKVYSGRSNEELTDRGAAQAVDISKKLKNYNIDAIYSSPMKRTLQTAGIIGEALKQNVRSDESFQELKMGPWEGLSEDNVAQTYPEEWKMWLKKPADLRLVGRETLDELLERVLMGIRKIYQKSSDETVLIVTHVAIIRVLLLWHSGKSLNLYKSIDVPNAIVHEVEINM